MLLAIPAAIGIAAVTIILSILGILLATASILLAIEMKIFEYLFNITDQILKKIYEWVFKIFNNLRSLMEKMGIPWSTKKKNFQRIDTRNL